MIGESAWLDANQEALASAVAGVRAALERRCGRAAPAPAHVEVESGSALDTVCAAFALSPFERDVLVLAAGVELDGGLAALCAEAQGDPQRTYATFGLALAALDDGHWSALVPEAPLRRWHLVELDARTPVTAAPLSIAERILHFLTGIDYLDEELASAIARVEGEAPVAPSQAAAAEVVARLLGGDALGVVQLCARDPGCARAVAAAAARLETRPLYVLAARSVPTAAAEQHSLARLWEREAALTRAWLLVDCHNADDPEWVHAVERFVDRLATPTVVSCRDPLPGLARPAPRVDASRPTAAEQRDLWRAALGAPAAAALNGSLDIVVSQFDLDVRTIMTVAAEARVAPGGSIATRVWDGCRSLARPRLDDLAQRLVAVAGWDDLVLPQRQVETLREIAAHVRHRTIVYERWGFARKSSRGLGIAALFSGPTGTGKTMAAEVLARELVLDLYRIDLSSVVSKYIGETEKNLRRVFDSAEGSGAILLFDEADAVFGKRTEVRDSHDRYANVEVSYLLQRIEAYRGLAILTTNLQEAIDTAFLRRIRFVVQFPFPDHEQRREIWRRAFPRATPVEQLDVERLSHLGLAGGSIRNVALNAAFLAADQGEPVGMDHLARAVRTELTKLDQPLTDLELEARA